MSEYDFVRCFYEGDLEKLKKVISNENDTYIYTINNLMHGTMGEEYRIGLIPLILKSEADHPGNFDKYKAILDFVAKRDGVSSVIFGWKNPYFSKYIKGGLSGEIQMHLTTPVSDDMNRYLGRMEERNAEPRKKVLRLLHEISENTRSADPATKKAIRMTKREIVRNYRLLIGKLQKG